MAEAPARTGSDALIRSANDALVKQTTSEAFVFWPTLPSDPTNSFVNIDGYLVTPGSLNIVGWNRDEDNLPRKARLQMLLSTKELIPTRSGLFDFSAQGVGVTYTWFTNGGGLGIWVEDSSTTDEIYDYGDLTTFYDDTANSTSSVLVDDYGIKLHGYEIRWKSVGFYTEIYGVDPNTLSYFWRVKAFSQFTFSDNSDILDPGFGYDVLLVWADVITGALYILLRVHLIGVESSLGYALKAIPISLVTLHNNPLGTWSGIWVSRKTHQFNLGEVVGGPSQYSITHTAAWGSAMDEIEEVQIF